MSQAILKVNRLQTFFRTSRTGVFQGHDTVRAVDGVSFEIKDGEVLGLVGESGCGKTTIGRSITKLDTPTGGEILFDGRDVTHLSASRFRPLRRDIQMIFQDPFASLNPRLTIEKTLIEPLYIHKLVNSRAEARRNAVAMLEKVGLDSTVMDRHPHEFSGGQRQRISIARVMIIAPRLIVADEVVSALDVSIQARVLNLIKKLQREAGISMLFISHDLGVVRHISDRIAVMYQGKIVEMGQKQQIFENPQHQYTKRLLASILRVPTLEGTHHVN
ncbi:MAG: ATP-binding cassette domain-containing protein [Gammaproteobacteria bacterium]|nr:ATP-binding cassette domain-containing protein [Gammaproteobacteria bacterium]